jgi:hypothetical protein
MFPFNPTIKGKLKYRDVFTGLVFAHPLDDQYLQKRIPGYYDGFEEEALRRAKLLGEDYARKTEIMIYLAKENPTAYKAQLPGRRIESLLEFFLFALNGMGLLIGVGAFVLERLSAWKGRRRSP